MKIHASVLTHPCYPRGTEANRGWRPKSASCGARRTTVRLRSYASASCGARGTTVRLRSYGGAELGALGGAGADA